MNKELIYFLVFLIGWGLAIYSTAFCYQIKIRRIKKDHQNDLLNRTGAHDIRISDLRRQYWEGLATERMESYGKGWEDAVAYEKRLVELRRLVPNPKPIILKSEMVNESAP